MTYFFIGRCVPSFGSNAIASHPDRNAWPVRALSTPFDTGALAKGGKIAVEPELKAATCKAYVSNHTYVNEGYIDPMTTWLNTAFKSPTDYPDGRKPRHHAVSGIRLDQCAGDDRVWTWEGRLPTTDYPESPLPVRRVFFSSGSRQPYMDWVRATNLATMSERTMHMRQVYAYSDEVDDAALGMLDFLRGELAP